MIRARKIDLLTDWLNERKKEYFIIRCDKKFRYRKE